MCLYENIMNGELDLADIARMNDYIACRAENNHRAHLAAARKAKG